MNMVVNDVKYRTAVRVFAIIDLVVTTISIIFLGLIVGATALGFLVVLSDQHDGSLRDSNGREMALGAGALLFLAVLIFFLLTIVQLVADMRLLRSTDLGTRTQDAIKLAKFWRMVILTMFVLMAVFAIVNLTLVGGYTRQGQVGLVTIFRIVAFVFVHFYITELEKRQRYLPTTGAGVVYAYQPDNNGGGQMVMIQQQTMYPPANNGPLMYPDLKQQPEYGFNMPPPPYDAHMVPPVYTAPSK